MKYECSKVRFNTEIAAQNYIDILKRTSNRDKIPRRSYLCQHCNTWHLTSSHKNEDTWREKYRSEIRRLGQIIKEKNEKISAQKERLNVLERRVQEQGKELKILRKTFNS